MARFYEIYQDGRQVQEIGQYPNERDGGTWYISFQDLDRGECGTAWGYKTVGEAREMLTKKLRPNTRFIKRVYIK